MIRLLIILLVIILYFTFVIYNMEDRIILKYMLGLTTQPLPVYLVILGSLVIGMFLAGVLTLPGWVRLRIEMRRQRKTIEQMDHELNRLVSITSKGSKSNKTTYSDDLEET